MSGRHLMHFLVAPDMIKEQERKKTWQSLYFFPIAVYLLNGLPTLDLCFALLKSPALEKVPFQSTTEVSIQLVLDVSVHVSG